MMQRFMKPQYTTYMHYSNIENDGSNHGAVKQTQDASDFRIVRCFIPATSQDGRVLLPSPRSLTHPASHSAPSVSDLP